MPQRKNKHRVQNDIHHSAQQYRDHAHAAEALGVDEIVHAKPQHHEHSAAQINGEVAVRIGESGITGAEQIQQRFFEREHQRREHKACAQQHGKGVAHNICGVGVVARPRAMEKSGAPPVPNRLANAMTMDRMGKVTPTPVSAAEDAPRDVADVDAVHYVIQNVNELRHCKRQRPGKECWPTPSLSKNRFAV